MTQVPSFNRSLLHPRYWLTWFGIGLLYLLVLLPYPILYRLGTGLGRISMHFLKRRVTITQRNLELCFPKCQEPSVMHWSQRTLSQWEWDYSKPVWLGSGQTGA